MKKLITSFLVCFLATIAYSQDDYRIGVNVGSGFNVKSYQNYDTGENKFSTKSIGILYQKRYYDWGYYAYGLRYSKMDIMVGGYMDGIDNIVPGHSYNQSAISLSLGVKPFFYEEYIFASMDLLLDFTTSEIKDRDYENHNGLGVAVGIGSDIAIGNLVLSINPMLRARSILDFYDRCGDCGDDHGPPMQFELFAEVGLSYSIF